MLGRTHFVIFKKDSCYSVTECGRDGLRQVFVTRGDVSGDEGVLRRLSELKPKDVTIEKYLERHAGHLIFA